MVEFEFSTKHNATIRAQMYNWIKANAKDAKFTVMDDRMLVIGVKLNEQDAVAFRLKFGL